ncbi:hypothetical protein Tco_1036968 [Tanacetum coccineum]
MSWKLLGGVGVERYLQEVEVEGQGVVEVVLVVGVKGRGSRGGRGRRHKGRGRGQRGRGRGQMLRDEKEITEDEIRKNLEHEYMEEMLLQEEQKFDANQAQQDKFDQEALRYTLEEEDRNLITIDANVQTQESVAANISDKGEIEFRLDKGKKLAEPSEQPELQPQAIKRGSKRKAPASSKEAPAKKRIIFHKNGGRSERIFF